MTSSAAARPFTVRSPSDGGQSMSTTSYSLRTASSARLSLSSRLNAGTSSISAPARSRVAGITNRFLRLVGSTASSGGRVLHEDVVDRGADVAGVDPEAGRRVALGVEVDHQHPQARLRQGGTEVDRGRGLAHAALLVGDGDDAGELERGPPRRSGSAASVGCGFRLCGRVGAAAAASGREPGPGSGTALGGTGVAAAGSGGGLGFRVTSTGAPTVRTGPRVRARGSAGGRDRRGDRGVGRYGGAGRGAGAGRRHRARVLASEQDVGAGSEVGHVGDDLGRRFSVRGRGLGVRCRSLLRDSVRCPVQRYGGVGLAHLFVRASTPEQASART